jgi:acyl-CoA reductase-like NAD-dependent aldehyde dehydrogenase
VFSGSIRHARAVAGRIDAGSVNINEGYRATFGSIDAPMGGMKNSGVGRRNGREGLLRFVEARTVAESTGVLTLPRTGPEWARLMPVMLLLLRVMKAIRRA